VARLLGLGAAWVGEHGAGRSVQARRSGMLVRGGVRVGGGVRAGGRAVCAGAGGAKEMDAPARSANRSATATTPSPVRSAHASCIWRRLVLAACTPAVAARARAIIFIMVGRGWERSCKTGEGGK
jgi:hypothetical protein